MTQTQTHPLGVPDPDLRPDLDPGPDSVRTPIQTPTQTRTPDHPDPDLPDHGLGLGPDDTQTQTQTTQTQTTQTQTQTRVPDPTTADLADKIDTAAAGLGPAGTRTRTARTARTARTPDLRPEITLGPVARFGVRRRARQRIIDEAIARGVEAERILREAVAAGEVETDDEPSGRWEKFVAGWPQTTLTIIVAILASVGQVDYARVHGVRDKIKLGAFDLTPWFAPAVLDLSVAALLGRGMYVAIKKQGNPWIAWTAAGVIGGFSVYTNTQHKDGAILYAAATAVGLISWMVGLIYKYLGLPHVKAASAQRKKDRVGRRATANPRLLTTSLLFASRKTATRGWIIARRRPVALSAERISEREGRTITVRTLTIRAAELYNSVLADRTVAELEALGDPPPSSDKALTQAWNVKRKQALDRAELVAWDAVDDLLGIPVIQREGIPVNRITYVEPEPQPQIVTRRAITDASAAAPAAPALPAGDRTPALPVATAAAPAAPAAAPVVRVQPRSKPAPAAAAAPAPVPAPGPNPGNFLPLTAIKGLEEIEIPADLMCACHGTKPCGKTLVEHIERRGRYIDMITSPDGGVEGWELRWVGNSEITEAIKKPSKGLAIELSWVLDQIRKLTDGPVIDGETLDTGETTAREEDEPADPEVPAAT